MAAALDGPHGLLTAATTVQARGTQLDASVASYQATEEANAALLAGRRELAGRLAPLLVPMLGAGAVGWLAAGGLSGRDPTAELQRLITDHPGIVDEVIGTTPGLLNALSVAADLETAFALGGGAEYPYTQEEAAGMLGMLYRDGTAEVVRVEEEPPPPAMTAVPTGISGLLDGLALRNQRAGGSTQGHIDVRVVTVTGADGRIRRSYIVDLPGTKDWQFDPTADRRYPNDFGTNLRLMALEPTLRTEAVADALHRSGAGPDDEVLLIGHSQGGMLAMEAAAEFSHNGRYNVTHVVTAGSPVARMPVPDHVRVLSLENAHDIVPHLDGQPNPDQPNRITVTFARQANAIGANHDMFTVYRAAGHDLDAVRDPSLDAYRASLQGQFIFNDRAAVVTVEPYVYDVKRGP
jgi:alpha/beta hydrolase fold